jgi:hypothetical protein
VRLPPRPPPASSLRRASARLGFLVFVLLAACGEPETGGAGRLEGAHLVVEGSPFEMGAWQGRLLRDRIERFHADWQERAFREAAGGDATRARRLREWCLLYVDRTLPLLPERVRQELDGLSKASGVPGRTLVLTDVMRDGLRYHQGPPRLWSGDLGVAGDGTSLAWSPSGPDAGLLERERLLVERRPDGGTPTVVLAWPGSLGGLAGASAAGVALAATEVPAPDQRHSLNGVPFPVSLRLALEEARDARAALERLSRTTSHRVVAAEPGARRALSARVDAVELATDESLPAPPEGAPVRAVWEGSAFSLGAWTAGPVRLR